MKWEIIVPIKRASGQQVYEVEAATEEEARRMWDAGQCAECVSEEMFAETLGEPEFRRADSQ